MALLKKLLDFYIHSSIHVAFSVFALVQMTYFEFNLKPDYALSFFAFCGTVVGYNFVKYDALVRTQKQRIKEEYHNVVLISFIAFTTAFYLFFQLEFITQILSAALLFLTVLYTVPFFPNKKNARNWAGVKIYMVTVCWVGVTYLMPLINEYVALDFTVILGAIFRFLLVFILILIFEINDLKYDDPHLQTVPQKIGVRKTKVLGFLLLMIMLLLVLINSNSESKYIVTDVGLVAVVTLFLVFVKQSRSKYYTLFWAESIPIVWWLVSVSI